MSRPFFSKSERRALVRFIEKSAGVILLSLSLALLLALFSYDPLDPGVYSATWRNPSNWLGWPGAVAADVLMRTLGVASFALALYGLFCAERCFGGATRKISAARLFFAPFATMAIAAFASAHGVEAAGGGGLGGVIGDFLFGVLAIGLPVYTEKLRIIVATLIWGAAAMCLTLMAIGATVSGVKKTFAFMRDRTIQAYLDIGAGAVSLWRGSTSGDGRTLSLAARNFAGLRDAVSGFFDRLAASEPSPAYAAAAANRPEPQLSIETPPEAERSTKRTSDAMARWFKRGGGGGATTIARDEPPLAMAPSAPKTDDDVRLFDWSAKVAPDQTVEAAASKPEETAVSDDVQAIDTSGTDAPLTSVSAEAVDEPGDAGQGSPEPEVHQPQTDLTTPPQVVETETAAPTALEPAIEAEADWMTPPAVQPKAPKEPAVETTSEPSVEPLFDRPPSPVELEADEVRAAPSHDVARPADETEPVAAIDPLPSLDLLAEPLPEDALRMTEEMLAHRANRLQSVLNDYGVRGDIIDVHPGPVVTLFELEPAPGLKASRVIGLADDIARSMSAVSARVSTVPGRNIIGIELPNDKRETVRLRELLAHQAFATSDHPLTLALGKDIAGAPVVANLARMPHLLIAGTTGSGKSVGINTMLLSLLYRLTPEQCRLILIDPKMLELSVYNEIPHLIAPVVTDPKKAVLALKWAVREMEQRYEKMARLNVRGLESYNEKVAEALSKGEKFERTVQTGFDEMTGEPIYETQTFEPEAMPLIVIVVDEMADLMMVAGKEIEHCVQRLAQMARASGIHLIMATQRPSVDVITGT